MVADSSFRRRVYRVVRRIPLGQTMSYQTVARAIGAPRAARAVANVLRLNYDPQVPCHRVIRSNGTLGGYRAGPRAKARLLSREREDKM